MTIAGLCALTLALVSAFLSGVTTADRAWGFAMAYAVTAAVLTIEAFWLF